ALLLIAAIAGNVEFGIAAHLRGANEEERAEQQRRGTFVGLGVGAGVGGAGGGLSALVQALRNTPTAIRAALGLGGAGAGSIGGGGSAATHNCPVGGFAQLLQPGAFTNATEFTLRIGNLSVKGNIRLPDPDTFVANLGFLKKVGTAPADLVGLLARLRLEAIQQGASQLIINAHNVISPALLRPELTERLQNLGFGISQVGPDSYQLLLSLPK
ncbi:MAG: hypothetical protein HY816_19535, partial [Candidatus Wallbacteria bacterium]|nr:hypothetical protein [Candidatus Wallbacteria bacterium]